MGGVPVVCYLTGTINSLLDKLTNMMKNHSSPTEEFSKLAKNLKWDLERLKRDFLDKFADGEEMPRPVTVWMKHVRDLVFDIEDWIDLNSETDMGDPSVRQKFIEFEAEIRGALDRCERYNLLQQVTNKPSLVVGASSKIDRDPPLLVAEKTCHGLFDGPRDKLVEHLLDIETRLKVVSVVGMEGLGKTTLAKEIYATRELQGRTECHAFVSVGRRSAMREILSNMLRQVNPESSIPEDVKEIISGLREYLRTKRYFIVVDGIWSTSVWKVINCALPANHHGSRVLVTTCFMDVGKFCCRHPNDVVYPIGPLSEMNSKKLFLSGIAPREVKMSADFKEVFGNMLNMCDGMPLAIIVAAGLFSRKPEEVAESKLLGKPVHSLLKLRCMLERMKKILQMSYADLCLPMRSCFLYLSIFPEDYTIKKDRLIRLWGAEGLIPRIDKESSWVTGERHFDELISRGLIQPVFCYDDDRAVGCTIHSVILDFIRSLSREENFALRAAELSSGPFPCDTIRRFSIDTSDEDEAGVFFSSSMHLSNMRSLTVFGDTRGIFDPPLFSVFDDDDDDEVNFRSVPTIHVSLSSFKFMRVLDLEDTKTLVAYGLEVIQLLVLLTYLGLRGTGISDIPKEIEELAQLETLDVRDNKYLEISIGRFPKLVRLLGDIDATEIDIICTMPKLEEVSMVCVRGTRSLGAVTVLLRKSKRLRMLGVALDISASVDNLLSFFHEVAKSNLHSLSFDCSKCTDDRVGLMLDSWKKVTAQAAAVFEPRRFELIISDHKLKALQPNMASLVSVTHLRIQVSVLKAKDLNILGSLPNLVLLDLNSWCSSLEIRPSIKKGTFPCLKVLLFKCHIGGMGLEFKQGAVPQLQRLSLSFTSCTLCSMDLFVVFGIEGLTSLTRVQAIIDCSQDLVSKVEAVVVDIREQLSQNPNKPTLELSRRKNRKLYPTLFDLYQHTVWRMMIRTRT